MTGGYARGCLGRPLRRRRLSDGTRSGLLILPFSALRLYVGLASLLGLFNVSVLRRSLPDQKREAFDVEVAERNSECKAYFMTQTEGLPVPITPSIGVRI